MFHLHTNQINISFNFDSATRISEQHCNACLSWHYCIDRCQKI